MSTLVECVPNFSEGRDKAKVDAIVEAMKVHGVYLLDREMDADHNRCVITLVGEREAIQEAAIRGVGQGRGADRSDQAPGRAPADGRGGRGAVYSRSKASRSKIAWPWRGMWARRSGSASRFRCISTKRRGHFAGAAEPGEHSARTVRRNSRRDCDQSRAQAGLRRSARASDGGSDGGGRAQVPDRLQRVSEHDGCRHREEDCQGRALLDGRDALCEGRGISGARDWRRSR